MIIASGGCIGGACTTQDVSDQFSDSFTKPVEVGSSANEIFIAYAIASTSGPSMSCGINNHGGGSWTAGWVACYEVSGQTTTGITYSSQNVASGCPCSVPSYVTHGFTVIALTVNLVNYGSSAGPGGYTIISPIPDTTMGSMAAFCGVCSGSSAQTSTHTNSQASYSMGSLSVDAGSTIISTQYVNITQTAVVAPNPNSENAWLFPMAEIFMLGFLFVTPLMISKTNSPKIYALLFFTGTTIGSLFAVVQGIVNIGVLVLFVVILIITVIGASS